MFTTKFQIEGEEVVMENGRVVCLKCGQSFARKQHLKNQMVTHTENLYKCAICNKIFGAKNGLNDHMSYMHNGEKKKK